MAAVTSFPISQAEPYLTAGEMRGLDAIDKHLLQLKLPLIPLLCCVLIESNPKFSGVSHEQIVPSAMLAELIHGIDPALRCLGLHVGIVGELAFDFHNHVAKGNRSHPLNN